MTGADGMRERLDELLLRRAVEGLDTHETLELEELLARFDDVDPWFYEEAAAAYWVVTAPADEELPGDVAEAVQARLASEGEIERAGVARFERPRHTSRRHRSVSGRWGWVAAAAALVLAVTGWWPRAVDQQPPPDLAEARDRLLAEAPDAVRADWQGLDHPLAQGVSGYVVWSDAEQRGFMTFDGIPDNDPSENQYQLWVFDAKRSEEHPVDGGVFDAPADKDEVVIPIRTKLPVDDARLFAVTLEPPGGVVVSDRDPLLWIAKPEGECDGKQDNEEA